MRILFLTHYFPPEVNAPAVRTYEHCRAWVQQGHEVDVITCVPNHPQGRPYEGYSNSLSTWHEEKDGVRVHRVWTWLARNRGFARRTLNYLSYMGSALLASLRVRRPDVVIATSPQFFCACAGFLAAGILRRPWVFEVRDLWPASIVAVGAMGKGVVTRVLESVELYLYRHADRIVTLTGAFRDDLVRRGIPVGKIQVVTNGITAEWFRPGERSAARGRLGLDGEFVVSYVGTQGMAHKLETMLEAADLLRQDAHIRFLIVGDGAERERIEALREKMGLDNVWMIGQAPREKARSYVLASDISVVLLRKAELFKSVIPSKIFEAMAAGVPVVLGVEGEAKRIVEEAGAGLCIEPENAHELADAILRLRSDGRLRGRLGENGSRAARERFDRGVLARRMLAVAREAVAGWCAR